MIPFSMTPFFWFLAGMGVMTVVSVSIVFYIFRQFSADEKEFDSEESEKPPVVSLDRSTVRALSDKAKRSK